MHACDRPRLDPMKLYEKKDARAPPPSLSLVVNPMTAMHTEADSVHDSFGHLLNNESRKQKRGAQQSELLCDEDGVERRPAQQLGVFFLGGGERGCVSVSARRRMIHTKGQAGAPHSTGVHYDAGLID